MVLGAPLDADELWLMSLSDDDEARMDAMFQEQDDDDKEGMRFLLFNICCLYFNDQLILSFRLSPLETTETNSSHSAGDGAAPSVPIADRPGTLSLLRIIRRLCRHHCHPYSNIIYPSFL